MAIESTNARHGAGVSRRRIVQGAAWATPAVLIATAIPAAAASTDTPTVSLTGSATRNSSTITYSVNVVVGGATAAYLAPGFTLTFGLPKTGGTWGATPTGWSRSGDIFTYTGASNIVVPGSVTLDIAVTWPNSSGLNGSTTTVSLNGTSGGGPVTASQGYVA